MKAWDDFLSQLEKELGADVIHRWLRPLKVSSFDAANLYLEAQDYFQALWFEEHIRNRAKTSLQTSTGRPIKIHIKVGDELPIPAHRKTQRSPSSHGTKLTKHPFTIKFDELDPNYTFDTFVMTQANFVPVKLLSELVGYGNPQNQSVHSKSVKLGTFNPIFIYGKEGTGKTHLLVSAAKMLLQKGLEATFVSAETFTEHVVNAIRAGEMSLFRETYRKTDVLLIDDVHLFSRKGATQEELFHTFNTLHLAGKQIILAANCCPQDLQMIEPRLVSRFEWGVALPVEPLKKEDLEQVLEIKTHLMAFPLSQKVKEYILETFNNSAKAVVKAVEALVLRFHLKNQSPHISSTGLTVPTVTHALSDIHEQELKAALTPDKIIQKTADHFGIPIEDILGKSQAREFVLPRQVVMYLCRKHLEMPYIKIGDLFNRDHSTVMSSIKRIEKKYDGGNKEILSAIKLIEQKC